MNTFPQPPSHNAPRTQIPAAVSTGAFPGGGWLAAPFVLGAAGALYASTLHDMFYVRDKLYAIAAACVVLLAIIGVIWMMRAARAKTLFREGVLLDAQVVRRVTVTRRRAGVAGYHITVQFAGPDGRRREATFPWFNQTGTNNLRVLLHGDLAGLYLSEYQLGPVAVSEIFRAATVRML